MFLLPFVVLTISLLRMERGISPANLKIPLLNAFLAACVCIVLLYFLYPPYSMQDTLLTLARAAISVMAGPSLLSIVVYVVFWKTLRRRSETPPHSVKCRVSAAA